jgi:hypothetical protein
VNWDTNRQTLGGKRVAKRATSHPISSTDPSPDKDKKEPPWKEYMASVSYKPVLRPMSSRLPTESQDHVRTHAIEPGHVFSTDPTMPLRCKCGTLIVPTTEHGPSLQPCTVYTLTGAFTCSLPVLKCTACNVRSHNMAGPDLGDLGYFNHNNTRVFAHDVLNKYLADCTTSQTPFAAFCNSMDRSYTDHRSEIPNFAHRNDFQQAVFAYTKLFPDGDDFTCPLCTANPDIVIADGITASYAKKFLTCKIHPPTKITSTSPRHDDVHRHPAVQLVIDAALRVTALDLVDARKEIAALDSGPARLRRSRELNGDERMSATCVQLSDVDGHLADLFTLYVVRPSEDMDTSVHLRYLNLLGVVR